MYKKNYKRINEKLQKFQIIKKKIHFELFFLFFLL